MKRILYDFLNSFNFFFFNSWWLIISIFCIRLFFFNRLNILINFSLQIFYRNRSWRIVYCFRWVFWIIYFCNLIIKCGHWLSMKCCDRLNTNSWRLNNIHRFCLIKLCFRLIGEERSLKIIWGWRKISNRNVLRRNEIILFYIDLFIWWIWWLWLHICGTTYYFVSDHS